MWSVLTFAAGCCGEGREERRAGEEERCRRRGVVPEQGRDQLVQSVCKAEGDESAGQLVMLKYSWHAMKIFVDT